MTESQLKSKTIALSTHFLIYSASQALRDFLRDSGASLFYISHPLPGVNPNKYERSYIEISKGKRIIKKRHAPLRLNFLPATILYEFILGIIWLFPRRKIDLYVGVDNFNAFIGLFLKLLGRVDRVVYYTIDYFPTRYDSNILNWIYHAIDKICVAYADETWNVSSKMIQARSKHNNMDPKIYNRQFEVPIGIWYEKAPRKDFKKIQKNKLIFVGHLVEHMGVDMVLEALPYVVKRNPKVRLEIIGGGDELENLKNQVERLELSKYVKFWGWVRDRKKLEEILSDGAVGLATFNTKILDSKVKNADPGKIKDYMLLGMPVIATDAISTAKILESKKCAIIVPYEKKQLADAIIRLLENEKKLSEYRNNALSYIQQFDYGALFSKNLVRIFENG